MSWDEQLQRIIRQVANAIQVWRDHYLKQRSWTYAVGGSLLAQELDLTRGELELGAVFWDRMLEEGAGGGIFPLAEISGVPPWSVVYAEVLSVLTGDTLVLLGEILDDEYRREIADIGLGPIVRFYNGRIDAIDNDDLRSRWGSAMWAAVQIGQCMSVEASMRLRHRSLSYAASRWSVVLIRDIARDGWCPHRVLGMIRHDVSISLQQLVFDWYDL